MFDRPESGDRAILVSLDLGQVDFDDSREEFRQLVKSAGVAVMGEVTGRRQRPDSALYAGKGKVEEIGLLQKTTGANLVIFNHALSPAQERNLERALSCRVIDRTSLILDIFAARAQSHEGKLQVELAQLDHLATRLVRGWTHLERQKGGIGLRGPGETQLETDRRLLGLRVKSLKEQLARVRRQRQTQRRSRQRSGVMSVSLVGYTNAGKSTLFNALTHAGAYAADQLFATLDTTSRRLYMPGQENIVLSDTVGFIRDLPHTLVAAFQATLEEAVQADLLLHVVDASHPERDEHIHQVQAVLHEIGADARPQILIMNKTDMTGGTPAIDRDEYGNVVRIWLSAQSGQGLELLRQALAEFFDRRSASQMATHTHYRGSSPQ